MKRCAAPLLLAAGCALGATICFGAFLSADGWVDVAVSHAAQEPDHRPASVLERGHSPRAAERQRLLPALGDEPPTDSTQRVRIVALARNGATTVPGATIVWTDELLGLQALATRLGPDIARMNLYEVLEQCGRSVVTDANGHAVIEPRTGAETWAAACLHDGTYGEIVWTRKQPIAAEYGLTLWPEDRFDVMVRDAAGAPVPHAALAIEWEDRSGAAALGSRYLRETLGPCDRAGRFQGGSKQRFWNLLRELAHDVAWIVHDAPGCDGHRSPLVLSTPTAEAVEVRSSQTGTLVVRVVDAEARPYRSGGRLMVDVPDARRGVRQPWYFILDEHGVASFAVAVASRVVLTVEGREGDRRAVIEARGPDHPSEVMETVVRAGAGDLPRWRARVCDGAGAWLVNQPLRVCVSDGGDSSCDLAVQADAAGSVAWSLPIGMSSMREVKVWNADGSACGTVLWDGETAGGDLGVVALRPVPFLAGVRVIDDNGSSVAGAQMRVASVDGEVAGVANILLVRTNDEWRLHGSRAFSQVTVCASAPGFCDAVRDLSAGGVPDAIQLSRARPLRVVVVTDPWVKGTDLVVKARRSRQGPGAHCLTGTRSVLTTGAETRGQASHWRFEVEGLAAGDYVVSVHILALPGRLDERPVSLVAGSEPRSAPEETRIDLRGRVRAVRVQLHDRRGGRLRGYAWQRRHDGADSAEVADACRIAAEGVDLLLPAATTDVWFAAEGHLLQRKSIGPGTACDVTLVPAVRLGEHLGSAADTKLSVTWLDGPIRPHTPCRLWSRNPDEFTQHSLDALLTRGAAGTLDDRCVAPGRYTVRACGAGVSIPLESICVIEPCGRVRIDPR